MTVITPRSPMLAVRPAPASHGGAAGPKLTLHIERSAPTCDVVESRALGCASTAPLAKGSRL